MQLDVVHSSIIKRKGDFVLFFFRNKIVKHAESRSNKTPERNALILIKSCLISTALPLVLRFQIDVESHSLSRYLLHRLLVSVSLTLRYSPLLC